MSACLASPEGCQKLAGGVSHRNRSTTTNAPRRGAGCRDISAAPSGAGDFMPVFRWLTPPANFRRASGSMHPGGNP